METTTSVRRQRPAVPSRQVPRQEQISVALIDDNRLLRERLTEFLNGQPGLQPVASAPATADAFERLKEVRPQVVLVGSCANGLVCHTCVRHVKQALPEARVVAINVLVQGNVLRLVEEGANGLLLQDATLAELLQTIRQVGGGSNVLPDPLVPVLFAQVAATSPPGKRQLTGAGGGQCDRLTQRERAVSDLIAEGLRNQAVADQLGISLHTVKTHVHSILAKLGLQSRLQIPVYMHKHAETESE